MYHHNQLFLTILEYGVCTKARFGGNPVFAHRTTPFLAAPEREQSCPSFAAVQHALSVPFLVVASPSRIEWVRLRHDFLESNDFRVGGVLQRQIARLLSGLRFAEFRRKRPSPGANEVPIPSGYPSAALLVVSALCPPPQTIENLTVYP